MSPDLLRLVSSCLVPSRPIPSRLSSLVTFFNERDLDCGISRNLSYFNWRVGEFLFTELVRLVSCLSSFVSRLSVSSLFSSLFPSQFTSFDGETCNWSASSSALCIYFLELSISALGPTCSLSGPTCSASGPTCSSSRPTCTGPRPTSSVC